MKSIRLTVGRVSQLLVHRLPGDPQIGFSESLILWIYMQDFVCMYKHTFFFKGGILSLFLKTFSKGL